MPLGARRVVAPAAAGVALLLAGCGSSGDAAHSTASVTSGPVTPAIAAPASTVPGPASGPSARPGPAGSPSGGPSAPSPRTQTAPSSAGTPVPGGSGLAAATAVLAAQGFGVVDRTAWEPEHTLRVLVGRRAGQAGGGASAGAGQQQAFFFVSGRVVGTDASTPSASVAVLHQSDRTVTLGYATFRPGDRACCPSGPPVPVDFSWTGTAIQPAGSIPANRLSPPTGG